MFIRQKEFFILTVVAVFSLAVTTVTALANPKCSEFPIAVGDYSTFAGAAAYDGTNYLVCIQEDSNISAQLVSQTGRLIGSRISVGRAGTPFPDGGACVAFDGTNYLMVWADADLYQNGDIYGQFIAPSGNLVGTPFPIAATAEDEECARIAFGDNTYMVIWSKNDIILGQRVDTSGNLSGETIQINTVSSRRDFAIAFDRANYLVVWVEKIPETDISIYGQLVSEQGALVGTKFLIDGSSYPSDNPVAICFDGSRYMVAFHEEINNEFHLFARFVTTSGTVAERITISDAAGTQHFPSIAFDGTNYLITWTAGLDLGTPDIYSMGRFFNTSGIPVDTVFTIFGPLGDKIPIFTGTGFGDYQYLAVTTRGIVTIEGSEITDGDVYGTFIQPYTTGVEEKPSDRLSDFRLQQNYPNPFNPTTTVNYSVSKTSFVTIKVYNLAGKEVATLLNEEKLPGNYKMEFNANNLPSGIYFYRMQSGSFTDTKKFILLR